jgi:hypothetical protein
MSNALAAFVLAFTFQTAPTQVEITADRAEMQVQESVQLSMRALDGAGRVIPDAGVRWISSTPEIASVDETGRVLATNPGTAKITAVVGSVTASTLLVIHELPATELSVRVPSDRPYAGQALPVRVTALNRLGDIVEVPVLTYESADPSVAAVDGAGLVFARSAGQTSITVGSDRAARSRPDLRPHAVRISSPYRRCGAFAGHGTRSGG